jgi:predicted lysophospholipase L1 biosynthesis ABC-type transport system permease subunit
VPGRDRVELRLQGRIEHQLLRRTGAADRVRANDRGGRSVGATVRVHRDLRRWRDRRSRAPALCIGLYAVVAFAVGQRVREIGIRTALGAGSRQVVRLFVRRGLSLCLFGLVIGFCSGSLAYA